MKKETKKTIKIILIVLTIILAFFIIFKLMQIQQSKNVNSSEFETEYWKSDDITLRSIILKNGTETIFCAGCSKNLCAEAGGEIVEETSEQYCNENFSIIRE